MCPAAAVAMASLLCTHSSALCVSPPRCHASYSFFVFLLLLPLGIHVHVGSQGCALPLTMEGIRRTVQTAEDVNKALGYQHIKWIDIGGGLSVNFEDERTETEMAVSFDAYAALLKEAAPALFSKKYKVFTEFGRRLTAKCGMIVSRVEYDKQAGDRNIAIIHAGADLFVRTIWMPSKWPLRVSVLSPNGELKQAPRSEWSRQDIAGPCCFGGDIVAHERNLPPIRQGDWVIAHDTGGYYYSAFSYYNLRQAPIVYAFDEARPDELSVLKPAVTVDETLAFFGSTARNPNAKLH